MATKTFGWLFCSKIDSIVSPTVVIKLNNFSILCSVGTLTIGLVVLNLPVTAGWRSEFPKNPFMYSNKYSELDWRSSTLIEYSGVNMDCHTCDFLFFFLSIFFSTFFPLYRLTSTFSIVISVVSN